MQLNLSVHQLRHHVLRQYNTNFMPMTLKLIIVVILSSASGILMNSVISDQQGEATSQTCHQCHSALP